MQIIMLNLVGQLLDVLGDRVIDDFLELSGGIRLGTRSRGRDKWDWLPWFGGPLG